jgi:hypothetical protein
MKNLKHLMIIMSGFFVASVYAYKSCEMVQNSEYYDCWCNGKVRLWVYTRKFQLG